MRQINWKVRIGNKYFWVAIIPMVLLLIQQILMMFNVSIDFSVLQERLIGIVGTVFAILGILGVVVDPTTEGVGDSELANTYAQPKKRI